MNRLADTVIPDTWVASRRRAANRLGILVYAYVLGAATVMVV